MKGVNPHYGGFLGNNFTPKNPYKYLSLLLEVGGGEFWSKNFGRSNWVEFDQDFQLRNTKRKSSSTNLLSSSFCPSLFEILLDRSCATPSVIPKRRFLEELDVHPVNEK